MADGKRSRGINMLIGILLTFLGCIGSFLFLLTLIFSIFSGTSGMSFEIGFFYVLTIAALYVLVCGVKFIRVSGGAPQWVADILPGQFFAVILFPLPAMLLSPIKHWLILLFLSPLVVLIWMAFERHHRSKHVNTVPQIPVPPAAPPVPVQSEEEKAISECWALLGRIRMANRDIEDEAMSAKIDRIEELAGNIIKLVRSDHDRLPKIHTFMEFYLPTTIKLLNAYAEMEDQHLNTENISSTMHDIEGAMDQIILAFEKQLDQLFGDDALDIAADISVFNNLASRNGLGADDFKVTDITEENKKPEA